MNSLQFILQEEETDSCVQTKISIELENHRRARLETKNSKAQWMEQSYFSLVLWDKYFNADTQIPA